jgi:peptidoglycan/xylan/chitin deacetylase (PgdA/CDA1 family)
VVRALAAALAAVALVPGPARAFVKETPVPILMYHVISTPPATAAFPDLFVRPADFAAQMRWLKQHGFHAVTLQRVYDHWTEGRPLPSHPIVITFDDGYLSQYTRAYTTLRRYGWPGVENLEVNFLKPAGGLRPWRVRRMIAAGWEIDAHTLTHPDLTRVGATQLVREVAGSRAAIRRRFHVPVNFFCYPAGRFDARVIAEVRRAGFLAATTTNYGLARPPDLFTLDRIRVNGSDGLAGFAAKLRSLMRSRY